jgi:hypothetical protein
MGPARRLVLAAAFAAGSAWAQPPQMRASEILGREVRTADGERLAIRDLVIDARTGRVEQLAVGRRDAARGESLRLYPVGALRSVAGELVLEAPTSPSSAGASGPAP